MAKKIKRFEITQVQSAVFGENYKVIVDRETGVNYLFVALGYGGGLTPLLDRNGEVIVTSTHSPSYDFGK